VQPGLKAALSYTRRNLRAVLLILAALALIVAAMAVFLPPGVDWQYSFRPAVFDLLAGRSPYHLDRGIQGSWDQYSFFNAPWALLPLIPIALLPVQVGRALLVIVTILSFTYVARRLGAKPLAIGLLLVSPPVMHGVLTGNIDWLAVLGFIMPPQIGLFFIAIKPQVGIAVAVFWLVEAWRRGRWREVLRTFWPISVTLVLSIIIFGPWPLRFETQAGVWWNASLWPMSIPVGLALLVAALHKRKIEFAMAASPCLSPYLMMHSWVAALLAVAASLPETAAAVVGFWILIIMRGLGR
jgi:hypothetical protein